MEMIAAILAVLKRGAAYVPSEPSFPRERIRFMMRDAGVDAVITQEKYSGLTCEIPAIRIEKGHSIDENAPLFAEIG